MEVQLLIFCFTILTLLWMGGRAPSNPPPPPWNSPLAILWYQGSAVCGQWLISNNHATVISFSVSVTIAHKDYKPMGWWCPIRKSGYRSISSSFLDLPDNTLGPFVGSHGWFTALNTQDQLPASSSWPSSESKVFSLCMPFCNLFKHISLHDLPF